VSERHAESQAASYSESALVLVHDEDGLIDADLSSQAVGELEDWQKLALEECDAVMQLPDDRQVEPDLSSHAVGELEDWQKVALDECDAAAAWTEEWQKEALDEYNTALYRRAAHQAAAAQRDAALAGVRLRLRRARSCLGGRRRPGRRSTRAASRAAGGGDPPDEPGPGERGAKHSSACLSAEQTVAAAVTRTAEVARWARGRAS
jgi:hypothetical protein